MRKTALILLLAFLLSACQADLNPSPIATASLPAPQPTETIFPATKGPPDRTQTPAPGATRTPASRIAVSAGELQGVQVQFWHPWTGEMAKAVDEAVKDFNRSNIWGITVSAASQGSISGLGSRLSSRLTDEKLPQVIAMPPETIAGYQEAGPAAAPLDDYLGDPQWGLTSAEVANFYPSFWNETSAGGAHYSIPVVRTLTVLFYNQTWAKELGFTQAPVTPADFRTQVCAAGKANVKTGNPDIAGTGGWIVNTASSTVYSWLAAYEAVPAQSPASPQLYDSRDTSIAFTYLRRLSDSSCAWKSRSPDPYPYFGGRQALLFSGTLDDLPALATTMTFLKSEDAWTVIPYPADNDRGVSITFGPSLAILKSTPQQQLGAWLFLRWMTLPRIQARLAAAGYVLPVRISALDLMTDFAKNNPKWSLASGWTGVKTQPLPILAWWQIAQRVLEDAAGQVFQPFIAVDKIPDVLKELDATVAELLNK